MNGNSEKIIEDIAEAKSRAMRKDKVGKRTLLKRVAVYSREPSVKDLGAVLENTSENACAQQLPNGNVILRY